MARVSVSLSDSIVAVVDEEAKRKGISRSELVAEAIDSYLKGVNQAFKDVHKLEIEVNQIRNQLAEKDKAFESQGREVIKLKEESNQARISLDEKIKEN